MKTRIWILLCGLILAVVTAQALVEATSPPPITHDIAGREQCLTCHGTRGVQSVPDSHTGFTNATCTGCHALAPTPAPAEVNAPPGLTSPVNNNDSCLACHAQEQLSMAFTNGDSLLLYVDAGVYQASVHGKKLCIDCHTNINEFPHLAVEATSHRQYSVDQYQQCQKCHFNNYAKTLDSMHYQVLEAGNLNAPLCTDCHGVHDITIPAQPRSRISQTCATCHKEIYQVYIGSVHGEALQQENPDVPVCTDCHVAHTIADPHTAGFRIQSVDLCSDCHQNANIMQKYGISTDVVKTYLQDFHGASVALIGEEGKDIWPKEAVCSDCHGVHNILAVDNPDSSVIKQNLVTTCRKCHPNADANFSGAWLSHYEPSIDKTPMVALVRWFYRLLIPFIVLGLVAHIAIDLRHAANRR